MPLYEYVCGSCAHRFERIRKFSDPPLTECPSCGGTVEKQISSPAIQFKGSGFYITDYAKPGKSEEKSGDKSGESSTKSPSSSTPESSSSESKSEPKAEKSEKTEKSSTSTETTSTAAKPAAAPEKK